LKKSKEYYAGVNGLKIFYRAWIPDNPKAVVQIVHGFAEHSNRYINVVNELIPHSYAVYANDLRGHGKSQGIRTYLVSLNEYIEDARIFYDIIQKKYPDLPIFLLGHSMGTIISIHFAEKYEALLNGLILSGIVAMPKSFDLLIKLIIPVVKLLAKFAPKLRLKLPLGGKFISSDEKVVEAYNNDPLVNTTLTINLAKELALYIRGLLKKIGRLKLPTLIQCGEKDLAASGLSYTASCFTMVDKTIKKYKGLHHEVYNEIELGKKKVLNDLRVWLDNHI